MEFDGEYTQVADYAANGVTSFNHNFDPGKTGILAEVNTTDYTESVIMEMSRTGSVLHTWNMADISTAAMVAAAMIPPNSWLPPAARGDWFHTNCAVYGFGRFPGCLEPRKFCDRPRLRDRGNQVDLGDPTKQWYEFPLCVRYALTAAPGRIIPSGSTG